MRGPLNPNNFVQSEVLKSPYLDHYFFQNTKECELDFSSPLSDKRASLVLEDFELKRLLVLNQNHTCFVDIYPSTIGHPFCDGVVTQEKKVGLLIRHADCQAAIFFDPKKKVIAASHAGYKGQTLSIYTKVIKNMKEHFACDPSDIKVAVSASLGLDHAEFIHYRTEFPEILHRYAHDGYMDLKQMALDEFLDNGLNIDNIDIQKACTFCDDKRFYSFRRDKTIKRSASLVFLK
jgi:YfiH family protein